MIKGAVSARAVALQDLLSDLKVLDKKTISLGAINLEIDEQSKRTLEEQRGVFICDDPECSCQLTKGC